MAPRPLSADASNSFSDRSGQDHKQTIMKSAFVRKSPKDTILSSGYLSAPERAPIRNDRNGEEHVRLNPFTSSGNASLSSLSNKMRPLHKPEIGGPKSPFLPIVRVPSGSVVGVVHGQRDQSSYISSQQGIHRVDSTISSLSGSRSKFSKVLDGWQLRDEKNTSRGPRSETLEYRFRPIISEDEKLLLQQPQPSVGTAKTAKKKVKKISIVEISFREDDSLGSISSMEYDGSEHDLDAVFQDAHLYPIHFDTIESTQVAVFLEAYHRDYGVDDETSQNGQNHKTDYVRVPNNDGDNNVLKMRDDDKNRNTRQNQKIVEAIEKDPDLSVANSTILKGITDKDPDLSIDGDENFDFFQPSSDRDLATRESNKVESIRNEFGDTPVKERNTPSPPLSEIFIPVTHDYGYGFYLKPLWTLDHKPTIDKTGRYQKVRELISEGRSRRSRSRLTKLVMNAMSE